MKDELDIAWAAGILEGEGCFGFYKVKNHSYKQILIRCKMTDNDIILRLQSIFGGYIRPRKPKKETNKPLWEWSLYKQADVAVVILKILPYLGVRRSAKAKELLAYIDSRKKPNAG